ncbi:MAG: 50S ribosomal protein L11 methyltransferase [Clostridia bacterium]
MKWIKTTIYTDKKDLDILEAFFIDLGITGYSIEDSDDFKEFLQDKSFNWDYIDEDLMKLKTCKTSATAYLADNNEGRMQLDTIKAKYGDVSMDMIDETDWANNWKQYFKPIEIGKRLVIKPTWEAYDNKDNRKVLEIDPGSSFGTGTHETTRLCLAAVEKYIKGQESVMDAGCGSGILGIAAMLLGAKRLVSFDIEEASIRVTKENCVLNGAGDLLTAYHGNILSDADLKKRIIGEGSYDVILANIVPDVIKAMMSFFRDSISDKGILVCSGIITERETETRRSMEDNGFAVIEILRMNGWLAMIGEKQNA